MPDNTHPDPSHVRLAPLRCRVEAPDAYRKKAQYAMAMLLGPLGLRVSDTGAPGLWYGSEPPDEEGWIYIRLDPETPAAITQSLRGAPAIPPDRPASLFRGGIPDASGGESGDPVATAFYWLAGMDELANPARDHHGRFVGSESLLQRLGLARAAPVDSCRELVAGALAAAGVPIVRRLWDGRPWCVCPTIDVDYLRKWRPGILYRETVQYGLLGRGPRPRWGRLARSVVEAVTRPDPYRRALSRMRTELDARQARATFFLKGGARSPHDVGYSLGSRFLRGEIRKARKAGHEVGLHPSYHAYNHPGYLRQEKERLEAVAGMPVTTVRNHYLRWDTLASPRLLRRCGFEVDSTLAFPDQIGFRNGTCHPFEIWDPVADEPSGLWEVPLAMMESALFNRMGVSGQEALHHTRDLAQTVQRFGGILVGLWHNVLWDEPDFAGWGEHFLDTLDLARAEGAATLTLGEVCGLL